MSCKDEFLYNLPVYNFATRLYWQAFEKMISTK